jgi:hypothetical protein
MDFIDLFEPRSGYYVMQKETEDKCIMPIF